MIMKKLATIFGIILMGFTATATPINSENHIRRGYDGNAFIFVEQDVEFSIFPDGQFDFVYIGPQKNNQVTVSSPNVNISFNSGYNYDAFVQYDAYGAVIQVENVPVYYDEFGRIVRAGNVDIRYNDRRLVRVGGLNIFYNNYGHYSHYSGAINVYNPYYVYRPWHIYYARPLYTHVIVYDYPYRRHYTPIRYSYPQHIHYYNNRGRVSYQNGRRDFYRPGSRVHQENGRVVKNPYFDPNRRNTMIANSGRNNQEVKNSRTTANTTRNSTSDGRGQSNVRSNNTNGRTNDNVRNANTVRTNNTSRNNSSLQTNSTNIRTNANAPVRSTNTRNSIEKNTNTRSIRETSTPRSVQPVQTRSSSINNNKGKSIRNQAQVPSRKSTNRNSLKRSNSSTRNNSALNSSRSSSSGQSLNVRGRG